MMSVAEIEVERQLGLLKKEGVSEGPVVVCVGDSITYGYAAGGPRGGTWGDLGSRAAGWRAVNLGMNGDTAGGMLARAQTLPVSASIAALALQGGGNDLMMGIAPAAVCDTLCELARFACSRAIEPIVCLSPCATPQRVRRFGAYLPFYADADAFDAARRALNALLRGAAAENGWICADFAPALCLPDGTADRDCYADTMHPNAEGHRRMAAVFAQALRQTAGGRRRDAR